MKDINEMLKKMDRHFIRRCLMVLVLVPLLIQSCSVPVDPDERNPNEEIDKVAPNAIVTVRAASRGFAYFQLDEKTTLEPEGWTNPFSREVRALLNYSELGTPSKYCTKMVRVNKVDSITTKPAFFVIGLDEASPDAMLKGCDPVELVSNNGVLDWMTVCEDGYLTIHFACFSSGTVAHAVSLVTDKANPTHLYFIHRNNGDASSTWSEGLAAFKIDHLYLALSQFKYGDPGKVTLHWMSFDGEKTATFKYGQRAIGK